VSDEREKKKRDADRPARGDKADKAEKKPEKKRRPKDEDEATAEAPDERSEGGAPPDKKWTTDELVQALRSRARKLDDGSPYCNEKILRALAKRGKEAVPGLVPLLEDSRSPVRWAAVATLGRLALRHGDAALGDAGPKLVALAEDKNAHVRAKAVEAVASLRSRKEEVLPVLIKALGDGDARVSRAAVMHVLELGVAPELLTERMIDVLTNKRGVYHRVGAVMVLFHLGKAAKAAVPHLVEAIEDPSAEVREYANLALMGIRTPSMRLQIIRTASMRLKAVDGQDEEESTPQSDEASGGDPGPPSSDERQPVRKKLRRRRRRLG
jgi:hypothetical protein